MEGVREEGRGGKGRRGKSGWKDGDSREGESHTFVDRKMPVYACIDVFL